MTPFTMGGKKKNDPHAARLSAMSGRIDQLRADITSDKERAEQLKAVLVTVDRLTLQVNRAQWEKDQADKRAESISKSLKEAIVALTAERDTLASKGSKLIDECDALAAQNQQLKSDVSRLTADIAILKKRRWWQWR